MTLEDNITFYFFSIGLKIDQTFQNNTIMLPKDISRFSICYAMASHKKLTFLSLENTHFNMTDSICRVIIY